MPESDPDFGSGIKKLTNDQWGEIMRQAQEYRLDSYITRPLESPKVLDLGRQYRLWPTNKGRNLSMCIVVPVMGELGRSKPFWSVLLNMVEGPVDLMIIDNAPWTNKDEGQDKFFERFVAPFWPGGVKYLVQDDNLGMVRSMQYAYENSSYDILAFIHNDLYVPYPGWDRDIVDLFEHKENAGLVGFFGGEGIHFSGGRFEVYSRMLEAEIHGYRETPGKVREVAVLDGMALIASRKMLDTGNGLDLNYDTHHFYDLDLSLESIKRGFKNYTIGLPIHHQSGQTACQPIFQDWANQYIGEYLREQTGMTGEQILYEKNHSRFVNKWLSYLPWKVGEEWRAK